MAIDIEGVKLGKLAPRFKRKSLQLEKYLPDDLGPPPAAVSRTGGVIHWPMFLNGANRYGHGVPPAGLGCCTISKIANALKSWRMSLPGAPEFDVPDEVILHYYERWDGYVPGDPSTDQGGIEIDVDTAWRREGFVVDGVSHGIKAFAEMRPWNRDHVKWGIELFGVVDIGLELPRSIAGQDTWDVVPGPNGRPGTLGGHNPVIDNYDKDVVVCKTWGYNQPMTWRFFELCCTESRALLSMMDWWQPDGLKYEQLEADLASVTG